MKIELINNQDIVELDLERIHEISTYASNKFDSNPNNVVNIILSGTSEIKELNKQCRNIDRKTDVLSFSYLSDRQSFFSEDTNFTVGEIYICPEVARDNAKDQGKDWSLDLEMILLVIHGMLHIYDYDHELEEEKMEMENLQDCLISDIRNEFNL